MPAHLSYFHAICKEPLLGLTLGDYLDEVSERNGTGLAIVDCAQSIKFSYKELKEQSDLLARGFLSLGVERGDRIGIWSTSSAQWLLTFIASAKVGAIVVNINPAYRVHELAYALQHSGTKILVVVPKFKTSNYIDMLETLIPNASHPDEQQTLPQLEHLVVIGKESEVPKGFTSFDHLLEKGKQVAKETLVERTAQLQFDDPINIQYTSGTTGLPKGVTLSHFNLLNNGYLAAVAMGLDSSVRFCVPMPFYHCGGMISSALAVLSVGGTVVIPGPFFQEEDVLKALQAQKCTHMSGVPTMFISLLEHPGFSKVDLSSMRGGFLAGAPCPVQLMRRVCDEMHMSDVVILYGLTEASPLMTCTNIEDALEVRATTVGRAIPGIEVKIIDTESGALVAQGIQGEVCSRGHGVMLGYWDNQVATEQAIDGAGWLHSGDLGIMKETGLINITGRKKDMIIRGGENIYPREVEDVLLDHPSIAQAQVFGIPDAVLGEDVAAWIMLRQGVTVDATIITGWLKERLSYFKVPRHIRIVEIYPMTVTGKIQKFAMRDKMIEELGLEAANKIQTA